uniref:CHK kinase-like domain-containing protein n=1 Tax=Timema bartmani TaxID=61472 RepID=A0A7R9FBF0_9NEOP|nr:unnamed protein product [Timema bartmani]
MTVLKGDRGLFKAVPQCYLARSDVLVLEDLKTRGFVMVDRKAGLDYHHCKAVVSELARFHALSLSMKRIDPTRFKREVSDNITEALFVIENEAWYRDYYKTASKNAIAMVFMKYKPGKYGVFIRILSGALVRYVLNMEVQAGKDEHQREDREPVEIVKRLVEPIRSTGYNGLNKRQVENRYSQSIKNNKETSLFGCIATRTYQEEIQNSYKR